MQGNVVDNRYDVVQPLGSGGMGEVYLARDRILDRDVALKVLRSQYANDRESAERFKREATSAARLSHPNIVQVYDRGDTEDGSSYIAMEYVPGGTLKDRIRSEGALEPGIAASYGYQVAEALGAAHEKGLIHRDIKPQNVLITHSGTAKVADFGIARALSAATSSETKTGTILGTAGYMSPEQALGRPATPKSDLYSLGVVLYEALTGELPFTAENPVAVSMKHVNEPPRPTKQVNPAVPDGLNTIVMTLLAKDPEDRYAGTDELAEDLWRARDGAPVAAIAPTPGETRTVKAPPQRPAPTTRRAPSPRRKRRGAPLILLAILLLLFGLLGTAWALTQGSGVRQAQPAGNQPRGEAVAVPDVVGLGASDARSELESAGLAVGYEREVPSAEAEGVVIAQSVQPGGEVQPGTEVALDISSGPPQPASSASSSASASAPQQEPSTEAAPADSSASADSSANASANASAEAGGDGRTPGQGGQNFPGAGNNGTGQGGFPGQGRGQGQGPSLASPAGGGEEAEDDGGED